MGHSFSDPEPPPHTGKVDVRDHDQCFAIDQPTIVAWLKDRIQETYELPDSAGAIAVAHAEGACAAYREVLRRVTRVRPIDLPDRG